MMMERNVSPWAVVTGASGGLGMELARDLARRGFRLLITARSKPRLTQVARELEAAHGRQVLYEVADLATATGVQQVFARAQQLDVFPEVLANNAGVGMYGEFADQDLASIRSMLQLDLISLTELTHLFAAQMRAGNGGRILLVGSMAAYQPVPMMAAYGAAKAYVLSFGEALAAELAPQINVCVLSPGIMETGFGSVSGYKHPDSLRPMILKASKVAQIGLDALFAGRSGVIAGRLNGLMALVSRLLPRRFSAQTTVRMERKTQR